MAAASAYQELYQDEDGLIPATFQVRRTRSLVSVFSHVAPTFRFSHSSHTRVWSVVCNLCASQVFYLIGWSPDPSQPKAAARGSGTVKFGDVVQGATGSGCSKH